MGIHGSGRLIAIISEASRRHHRHHGKAVLSTRQGAAPANDNFAPAQVLQLTQLTLMVCVFVVLAILIYVLSMAL
jgi:hypothetical protein